MQISFSQIVIGQNVQAWKCSDIVADDMLLKYSRNTERGENGKQKKSTLLKTKFSKT